MEGKREGLLRVLYLTIFLTSTGFGTATFLLPVFAQGLGASYIDLGMIGAVGNAVYSAMTLISGFLLDRYERIRFYTAFAVLGSLVVLLFSATTRVWEVVVVRGLMAVVSAAFWVAASTLTADISPLQSMTRSMGRYNLSWIAGFIVGPSLGGVISGMYGFPALFIFLSVLVALSAVVIWARMRPGVELRNSGGVGRFDLSPLRDLRLAYLTVLPFTLVLGTYMAIVPGHLRAVGLAPSVIGLLITMTNGVRGAGFLSVERLVAWGVRRSLWLASALLSAGLLLLSLSSTATGFVVPLALYGLAAGIITPVVLDFIAKRTARDGLGTAMGVHEGIYGLGMCVGTVIGGAIAESLTPSTMYRSLAILSLFIIPLSYLMTRKGGDQHARNKKKKNR
jgi:MFS family permease